MKKILLAIVALLVLAVIWGFSINNKIITLDQKSQKAWGDVETAYQRRADLIPNLIATVEKSTSYEKETLTEVINARAKATSIQVDPSNLTPEKMAEFQGAQSGLSSALGRLLVSVERYPDLKANQSIMAFQSQLEGTENRIKIERDKYNGTVEEFNSTIQRMPNSIVAGLLGKTIKAYFKSDAGAENAPKVEFK